MTRLALIVAGALGLAACETVPMSNVGEASSFSPNCPAIGSFLDNAVAEGRTAGASTLIWKDGQEVCFETAGLASREDNRPFARDTLVQIFSMTKPVTGVALMRLWEQGKFGLDDPLYWHLPEYRDLKVATGVARDGSLVLRDPSRPPTVRDVLRHTAGFTYGDSDEPADRVWAQLEPLSADNTLAEFSAKMAKVPLRADPGTRWIYSASVDVQARLVEVLSGMAFDQYVTANIFTPLRMTDSAWKRDNGDLDRLARIYVAGENGTLDPMPREQWLDANFSGKPMTMGGSGIVTTVDDYMRFARMLLNEGELDERRILRPATIRLMATDMLDPRISLEDRSWLPSKGAGGFGFNFFVRTAPPLSPGENRGTVGEFFWDGLPSMLFWVDPAQNMAVVFATQKIPLDNALHRDFRVAVFGADYPGVPSD
jgi:CubicO group peptidase (beta-lactamase class C family)